MFGTETQRWREHAENGRYIAIKRCGQKRRASLVSTFVVLPLLPQTIGNRLDVRYETRSGRAF